MKTLPSLALLAAGLLLAAAPAARAQDDYSTQLLENSTANYNANIGVLTNGIINKSMMDKTIKRYNARGGAAGTAGTAGTARAGARAGTAKAAPASPASLRYAPTPAAQRAATAAFAQRQVGNTPAAKAKFVANFGPGGAADYAPLYAKLLAGSGLRNNDVADAFAACLVATYRVAHGETPGGPLLPAGPTAAVRAQFADATARTLAGRPAGTAAELGEFLKLQTVLISVGAQGTDAAKTAAFRQNVATLFKGLYKLDVNDFTLTERGLAKQ